MNTLSFGGLVAGIAYGEYLNHIREVGTTNTGPRVNDYLAAAGLGPGYSWCGAFVTWVLRAATLASVSAWSLPVPYPARVASWKETAEKLGCLVQGKYADGHVSVGDIVLYSWSHMGVVYRIPMEMPEGLVRVWAVEGNTSDPDNSDPAAQREGVFVEARTRTLKAEDVTFVKTHDILFKAN